MFLGLGDIRIPATEFVKEKVACTMASFAKATDFRRASCICPAGPIVIACEYPFAIRFFYSA
jgi:hypothetical protein